MPLMAIIMKHVWVTPRHLQTASLLYSDNTSWRQQQSSYWLYNTVRTVQYAHCLSLILFMMFALS